MCYESMCPYQDWNGECKLMWKPKPEDAKCQIYECDICGKEISIDDVWANAFDHMGCKTCVEEEENEV